MTWRDRVVWHGMLGNGVDGVMAWHGSALNGIDRLGNSVVALAIGHRFQMQGFVGLFL
jgi:hypothetical protein